MTSGWILRNLWHWSLIAGAIVGAAAVSLALLRVRAPRTRLSLLETTFVACLILVPLLSVVEQRHPGSAPVPVVASSVEAFVVSAVAAAGPATAPWGPFIVVVWAGGIVARAAWLVVGLRRLHGRRGAPTSAAIEAEAEELQARLRTRARIEWRDDIIQPATFGFFPARVLLPSALAGDEPVRRRAVLCHELVHVRRFDWHRVVIEEAARSVFWFHPAVHWLIAELRLVREQVVDREVIEQLGNRTAYLNVLYSYASREAAAAGLTPFFGRRQLERRVKSLLTEVSMSRLHRFTAALAIACFVGGAGSAVRRWYPLDLLAATPATAQDAASVAGPLEQRATALQNESSVPRRTHVTRFTFPPVARGVLASALVTVRIVVDASGSVSEARVLRTREEWRSGAAAADMAAATRLITEDAVTTVRQWRYEPPASPVFWTMTVFYNDGPAKGQGERAGDADAAASGDAGGQALRVGGVVRAPEKLVNVAPTYPQAALDAGIEGLVSIEATIDESGAVSEARVLRSIPELDDAALEAVRQWKYRPTLMNGAAVPVIMTITINFALPR